MMSQLAASQQQFEIFKVALSPAINFCEVIVVGAASRHWGGQIRSRPGLLCYRTLVSLVRFGGQTDPKGRLHVSGSWHNQPSKMGTPQCVRGSIRHVSLIASSRLYAV